MSSSQAQEKAPEFTFNDSKGKTHSFSDYRGKWVLVKYWVSYYPLCRDEIPVIERYANDNKDVITILGMDAGGSVAEELDAFRK